MILAAMDGDDNQTAAQAGDVLKLRIVEVRAIGHGLHGVHDGVPSDQNPVRRHRRAQKIPFRRLGRREVKIRERTYQRSVDLFREGVVGVEGPEPRFDVADGNVLIRRGESRGEHAGRIALHQHHRGPKRSKRVRQGDERAACEIAERLIDAHQSQVHVGLQIERGERLVEQLAMLAGAHEHRVKRDVYRSSSRIMGANLITSGLVPTTQATLWRVP